MTARIRRTLLLLMVPALAFLALVASPTVARADSVTVSPTSVQPGQAVSVSWSLLIPGGHDWLSMHAVGATDSNYITWAYVNNNTNNTQGTKTFTAPSAPGTYEFRLFRSGQKRATSNSFTVSSGSSAPAAPTNLRSGTVTSNSIQLQWSHGGSNVSRFILRRWTGSWTEVTRVEATQRSYTFTNLAANTTYYLTVSASNSAGDTWPSPQWIEAKTLPPPQTRTPCETVNASFAKFPVVGSGGFTVRTVSPVSNVGEVHDEAWRGWQVIHFHAPTGIYPGDTVTVTISFTGYDGSPLVPYNYSGRKTVTIGTNCDVGWISISRTN